MTSSHKNVVFFGAENFSTFVSKKCYDLKALVMTEALKLAI